MSTSIALLHTYVSDSHLRLFNVYEAHPAAPFLFPMRCLAAIKENVSSPSHPVHELAPLRANTRPTTCLTPERRHLCRPCFCLRARRGHGCPLLSSSASSLPPFPFLPPPGLSSFLSPPGVPSLPPQIRPKDQARNGWLASAAKRGQILTNEQRLKNSHPEGTWACSI
jgi:hypothetical protein